MRNVLLLTLSVLLWTSLASAAGFPDKTIQIVVPWKPGGGSDISARIIAERLKETLHQPIVISNIDGASGLNGAMQVYKAKPDGYTLLWEHPGNLAVAPMITKAAFTWKDFDSVCIAAKSDSALIVGKDSPFKTAKEAFEYIKANPGKIRWSLAINGVSQFTYLAVSEAMGGLTTIEIPSPGDKARIVSILGNNSDITTVGYSAAEPYVKSGDIRILAVANDDRSVFAPDTPTLKELGYNASYDYLYSVLAPKGTPDDVKKILADAFKEAVNEPKTAALLREQMIAPWFRSPEDMMRTWSDVEDLDRMLAMKYGLMTN